MSRLNGRVKTPVKRTTATKAAPTRQRSAARSQPKSTKPRRVAGSVPAPHLVPPKIEDRPLVYVNGQVVPKSKAMVSVYDHGLLYGDGVFEGIRVYRGRIFLCAQHMDRLWRSAERIRLTIPCTRDEMVAIQRKCIEANEITEGYIRLLVTRGYGTLGLDPRKCPKAGVICIADQIALYPAELYEKGMRVVVAQRPKMPIAALDPRIKSLNYLNNILAKCEAIDAGCHEAIMLNMDGDVTECTGDNLFIVKDGRVLTPPPDVGLLEGCTREFVLKRLCPGVDIPAGEARLRMEDVLSADEVFLTGTAAEIVPVTQIDQTVIGGGSEGPTTRKLRQAFREIVTSDDVPEE